MVKNTLSTVLEFYLSQVFRLQKFRTQLNNLKSCSWVQNCCHFFPQKDLKVFKFEFSNYIRCTNKFPPLFIKNWAFNVKERNLMFYSKYCSKYCFSCVWPKSWSNNASNSASSYTFGLPLRSLPSMSNSPFLNFWNHSRQLLSLKAASPYLSTSNRCASAANFFKLKKWIKSSRKWRLFGSKLDIFAHKRIYISATLAPLCDPQNSVYRPRLRILYSRS